MNTHEYDTETHEPDQRDDPVTENERDETETDTLELAAQVELLAEENQRLRREYTRARQARYRRTALSLLAVGLVAVFGGVLFPDTRDVLFAIGATGVFAGVLTYYLTPGQFVAASVGERVYAACAQNLAAIATELGLRETYYYVPTNDASPARLFVSQSRVAHSTVAEIGREYTDGSTADRQHLFVLNADQQGLLLETTGGSLFTEFTRSLSGEVASTPTALTVQLCDGLLEQFELVSRAEPDVDATNGRVTVSLSGSAFGDLDRFDHPIPSFLATGLAAGLEKPVRLEVDRGDERADWLVTCRFDEQDTSEAAFETQ